MARAAFLTVLVWALLQLGAEGRNVKEQEPSIHTVFSTECNSYFDWQVNRQDRNWALQLCVCGREFSLSPLQIRGALVFCKWAASLKVA